MPGHFGATATDDGLELNTNSSTKSGVFGRDDSTTAATAPGGSGVFGLTIAPGGVGVFGANNNPASGRGVQGNGPEAGVGGFSEKGTGVPRPKQSRGWLTGINRRQHEARRFRQE